MNRYHPYIVEGLYATRFLAERLLHACAVVALTALSLFAVAAVLAAFAFDVGLFSLMVTR